MAKPLFNIYYKTISKKLRVFEKFDLYFITQKNFKKCRKVHHAVFLKLRAEIEIIEVMVVLKVTGENFMALLNKEKKRKILYDFF